MVVGTVHRSNNFGDLKIVEYHSSTRVTVEFINTGFTIDRPAGAVRRGIVKDLYAPAVAGVGYLGVGKYTPSTHTRAYSVWSNMIRRCYCSKQQAIQPRYVGCTVSREWHCFQDFTNWFCANYIEGYQLDKDIIGTGKEYSPSNCIFVSQEDNVKHSNGTLGTIWVLADITTGEDIHVTSQNKFAKENGLHASSVNRLCCGKSKKSGGYVLKEVKTAK